MVKRKNRLTITDVAASIGVVTKTIIRWERSGKVKKAKRDLRGWRVYAQEDLETIRRFYDSLYVS